MTLNPKFRQMVEDKDILGYLDMVLSALHETCEDEGEDYSWAGCSHHIEIVHWKDETFTTVVEYIRAPSQTQWWQGEPVKSVMDDALEPKTP